jgi:hypothetical protein
MTEKRQYHLRLKDRFAWYDTVGSQMFHEFPAGAVVTNPTEIALLEAHHAPTEKIFEITEFKR